MSNLKDLKVVITGASSGFGMEAAKLLVKEGCKVTLGARREDRLKELCSELGDSAAYSVTDVKKKEDLDALVKTSIDTFGGVDAIVNNAGIMPLSLIKSGRIEEWDDMIDVNIKGVLYGTSAVFNHFMDQGHGKIVNISSVAGRESIQVQQSTRQQNMPLMLYLKACMESAGVIQVTCIFPGAFITELAKSVKDEAVIEMFMKRGLGKIAQPAEKVALSIKYALEQDQGVSINDIIIRPTAQEM